MLTLYRTYLFFDSIEDDIEKDVASSDWQIRLEQATQEGKNSCTNNDLYVENNYYSEYVEPVWWELKNKMIEEDLTSREWNDYEFLLRVCDDLNIRPYIINVSCNGWYYDYRGLDSEKRQKHYLKIDNLAEKHNIDTYSDLAKKEYEPYVFVDVMHLGWKGWLYVSEAITNYFQ